jgi:hypothetical protein
LASIKDILIPIELHAVEDIKNCFAAGISPNDRYNNQPLIFELTSEYTRSPRFKDCVKAFIDAGLEFDDSALLAVLSDDDASLKESLRSQPEKVHAKYSMRCAYTPMHEVTLLHLCAEFNHVKCANTLVEFGADVNAQAGVDEHGFGGQTPIFHTVNQNSNQSMDMLNYLLTRSVDLKHTIKGLIWGKGYDWETLIPAVNPISYAMMGLLPQMHRNEQTISQVVSTLLQHEYGITYVPENVPNRYLKS